MNPRRILADFNVYRREFTRNSAALFFSFAFPVIIILLFGAIFSGGSNGAANLYVQNLDAGTLGASLVSAINQTGSIHVFLVPSNASFPQYLLQHSYPAGLLIPANFSRNALSGVPENITIYTNPADSSSQSIIGVTLGILDSFNLKLQDAVPLLGLNVHTVNEKSPSYVDFLVPGLIGLSILISPMFSMVNVSSEYKRTKLFKQLSLTPLTKGEWLIAKIIWYLILSFISFILMVATGVFVFHASVSITLWVIPFIILGPVFFVSLGMLVGTVTKTEESAGIVGNIITFPMMFLSGTFFPLSIMPLWLQEVARIFPLYYIINGMTDTMVYTNYSNAELDSVVVGLLCLIAFVAAVYTFKWRED
jgi:ABC-2 type transport system permease protein